MLHKIADLQNEMHREQPDEATLLASVERLYDLENLLAEMDLQLQDLMLDAELPDEELDQEGFETGEYRQIIALTKKRVHLAGERQRLLSSSGSMSEFEISAGGCPGRI